MKKSPFIIGLTLALALSVAGCNNVSASEDAIINKLSHELDRVGSTVSATSEDNNKLSISSISKKFSSVSDTSYAKLSDAYQKAKQISTNTEDNRERVLRKVKLVKRNIAGGVKLSGENARAISELTAAMQRYTTSLGKTKSDYRNTVRSISKLENLDGNEIDAKITRLGCCLQARDCYMQNILYTLNNIQSILDMLENDGEASKPEQEVQTQPPVQEINDTQPYPAGQAENTVNNFNYNGANGYYGYGNGYGYGGGYRNTPFNPNRNTDTYGPGVTNIDTYRNFGYDNRHFGGSNGINSVQNEESDKIDDLMLPEEVKVVEVKEENCDKCENSTEEDKKSLKKQIAPPQSSTETRTIMPSKTLSEKAVETENKVKGHTQSAMIDINQKIEKLIRQ